MVNLTKEANLLSLSGVQHFAFCQRQWALIHIESVWNENIHTVEGDIFHTRVHTAGYYNRSEVTSYKGVWLKSYKLGLIGIADIVEVRYELDGKIQSIWPVEYKKGSKKVNNCDRLQLAAQVVCLEEMLGLDIKQAYVYYGKTKKREKVPIDSSLRKELFDVCNKMHQLYLEGGIPMPHYSTKCDQCSLYEYCMPKIENISVNEYWGEFEGDL